jgi:hypothetical protein
VGSGDGFAVVASIGNAVVVPRVSVNVVGAGVGANIVVASEGFVVDGNVTGVVVVGRFKKVGSPEGCGVICGIVTGTDPVGAIVGGRTLTLGLGNGVTIDTGFWVDGLVVGF